MKKKPPLGVKRDLKSFTENVRDTNPSGDLSKGGTIGSSSLLIQSPSEWKEERNIKQHSRNVMS